MKDSEYRAIPRLSYSSLKDLFISPELFMYKKHNKVPPNDNMIFGTAFHHMLLGTEDKVKVLPELNLRTKLGKEALLEFKSTLDDEEVVVSQEDFDKLKIMQSNAFSHGIASKLLNEGEKEVPLFFSVDGVDFKAKLDVLSTGYIADPKTFYSDNIREFTKNITDSGMAKYHLQAACYTEAAIQNGYAEIPFYFIVCSKLPPYQVHVVELESKDLQKGRDLMYKGALLYKEALENDFKSKPEIIKITSNW